MEYLLGIDIGTSGTKTVLFDRDANPITAKTFEYPLYQDRTAGQSRSLRTGGTQ